MLDLQYYNSSIQSSREQVLSSHATLSFVPVNCKNEAAILEFDLIPYDNEVLAGTRSYWISYSPTNYNSLNTNTIDLDYFDLSAGFCFAIAIYNQTQYLQVRKNTRLQQGVGVKLDLTNITDDFHLVTSNNTPNLYGVSNITNYLSTYTGLKFKVSTYPAYIIRNITDYSISRGIEILEDNSTEKQKPTQIGVAHNISIGFNAFLSRSLQASIDYLLEKPLQQFAYIFSYPGADCDRYEKGYGYLIPTEENGAAKSFVKVGLSLRSSANHYYSRNNLPTTSLLHLYGLRFPDL
ncbi:MAG: hypothetical protein ACRC11_19755 [Xenococcaceae cyanobacterium]